MKIKLTILSLLFVSTLSFAQNYKFGKVSKEELSETKNDAYPEAEATVLYREHKVRYEYRQGEGFTLYTDVFERVKIYNTDGFGWGTIEIKVYNKDEDREEISGLKAVTYNLEGGSVKKGKLSKKAIFETRTSNYYVASTFTMPNLKEGSIVEYAYTIQSPFSKIDDISLQYTIPIKKEVVEVKIPEYYVYSNYGNPQAKESFAFDVTGAEQKIEMRSRSGIGSANYSRSNSGNGRSSSNSLSDMVKFRENIYTLDETNIAPLKREAYVDNLSNYQAKSIWELAMINFPGSAPKNYSTNWTAVTEKIYNSGAFSNELNKTKYFQNELGAALEGTTDPMQKAATILGLVKSKVKWNKGYGYYPGRGVKKAFSEGTGDVAEINLMLVAMLREAGLNANPVLLSTRAHGIPAFPTLYGFNYVIASLEFNGEMYLLDGTDPLSSINLLPSRVMNWQGRIIKEDGTSGWIGLYPGFVSQRTVYAQADISGEDSVINVREQHTGHYAKEYRARYIGTTPDAQMEGIEQRFSGIEVSGLEGKNVESLSNKLNLTYAVESSSVVEEINGDLYLSPMLFFAREENPFKSDTRDYPINFSYPSKRKYNITIKIPEGYKVSSLPAASRAEMANNYGSYSYIVKEGTGVIQLSVELVINSPIILPEDYDGLKAMYGDIVTKESEKIVLSKG